VFVRFPAADGDMGILGNHSPLVARVGAGIVAVEVADGTAQEHFISGGFAQFRENVLTVLCEECMPPEELSPENAWDQLTRARDLPQETPVEKLIRYEAVQTARTRFRLAQKCHVADPEQQPEPADEPEPSRT